MNPNPKQGKDGLREVRCSSCGRFLGLEHIVLGIIRLKCPNCGNFTTLLGEKQSWKDIDKLEKIR